MAVTPRRWILILALGCLALGVTLLPPRGMGVAGLSRLLGGGYWSEFDFVRDSLRFRRSHLSQAINRTETRLAALRLRDSLIAPVREARGAISVVSLPGVPSGSTARARVIADELSPRLGGLDGAGIRIVLAVGREQSEWRASHLLFLPGTVATDACVVAVKKKLLVPGDLRELVSPCVFYAAFGLPGDSVAEWLAARGYDVARDHAWWTPAPSAPAGKPDVSWWSSRFLAAAFRGEWPTWVDLERPACQAGQETVCTRTLLAPRRSRLPARLDLGILGLSSTSQSRWYEAGNPARDGALAELVREFGAARFAAFWQSSRPVEEAFVEAFGEPLGRWARRWTQRRLGVTYSGPVVHWQGALGWLVAAGVAVLVSAVAAGRRRVT